MSNIAENLQKILSSIYGKDVRQAIHDSIEDCYNDGRSGATDLTARQMLAQISPSVNALIASNRALDTLELTVTDPIDSSFELYTDGVPLKLYITGNVVSLDGVLKTKGTFASSSEERLILSLPSTLGTQFGNDAPKYYPKRKTRFVANGSGSAKFMLTIDTSSNVYFSRYNDYKDTSVDYMETIPEGSFVPIHMMWVCEGVPIDNAVGVVTDKTLSIEDMPADAKSVGDEIDDLKSAVQQNKDDISAEETRATAEEARLEALFTAPTQEAVDNWLDAHPEATTTVVDGSLTEAKFSDALKLKTIKDYVTPKMFGAVGNGIADDTDAFQNAIDYAYTNGLYVYIPKGKYLITDSIYVGKSELSGTDYTEYMKIVGVGSATGALRSNLGAEILCETNKPIFCVNCDDDNKKLVQNGNNGVEISNIYFNGSENYDSVAIKCVWTRISLENIAGTDLYDFLEMPSSVYDVNGNSAVNYCDVASIKRVFLIGIKNIGLQLLHCDIGNIEQFVSEAPAETFYRGIEMGACSAININGAMFSLDNRLNPNADGSYVYASASNGTITNLRIEHSKFAHAIHLGGSSFVFNSPTVWYDAKTIFYLWQSFVTINNPYLFITIAEGYYDYDILSSNTVLHINNPRYLVGDYSTSRNYSLHEAVSGANFISDGRIAIKIVGTSDGLSITDINNNVLTQYGTAVNSDSNKIACNSRLFTAIKPKAMTTNVGLLAVPYYSGGLLTIRLYNGTTRLTGTDFENAIESIEIIVVL